MTIPSTNISLAAIQAETGYGSTSNISLTTQSQNAITAGNTINNTAPYGMHEWIGYVHATAYGTLSGVVRARTIGSTANSFYRAYSTSQSGDGFVVSVYALVKVVLNTSGCYLQVAGINAVSTSYWYNLAGAAQNLGNTYVTAASGTTGFTSNNVSAVQLIYGVETGTASFSANAGATYFPASGAWQSLSNGQSAGFQVRETTPIIYASESGSANHYGYVTLSLRGPGKLDTEVYALDWYMTVSGSSTSCFTAGSLVTMGDGSTKAIETVVVGEELMGNEGVTNTVIQLRHHEQRIRQIYVINNYLETTETHPILTTDGWKSLLPEATTEQHPELTISMLEIGDTLVKYNTSGVRSEEVIETITSDERDIPVYNFDVTGNDTFIVNDVVVHNK